MINKNLLWEFIIEWMWVCRPEPAGFPCESISGDPMHCVFHLGPLLDTFLALSLSLRLPSNLILASSLWICPLICYVACFVNCRVQPRAKMEGTVLFWQWPNHEGSRPDRNQWLRSRSPLILRCDAISRDQFDLTQYSQWTRVLCLILLGEWLQEKCLLFPDLPGTRE